MNKDQEEQPGTDSSGRFHTVQPIRDLESNWAVDIAKNLEEYLLKICSGEITSEDDGPISVNFTEAALLLQGSIQVYSRKVEYLYSLVLHALEFISQRRQNDQPEDDSVQREENGSNAVPDEENDMFWCSDDIPVEPKNSLDNSSCKDVPLNHYVKPPANLVVLEGDCLGATDDDGELESYLLATSNLYQDFILLDPSDVVAVDDFLHGGKAGKATNSVCRGSSLTSKSRKSFQSPTRLSGGTCQKSSARKNQDANLNQSPMFDHGFDFNDCSMEATIAGKTSHEFEMGDGYSEPRQMDDSDNDDDNDDPWKPLNPHEPGNLKVKPFKKVKVVRRPGISSTKQILLTESFPPARLHGTISSELTQIWEKHRCASEEQHESQSPPLYEKLRQSLVHGEYETYDVSCNPKDDNGDDSEDNDFGPADFDMPESVHMFKEENLPSEKCADSAVHNNTNEACSQEDPNFHGSLEDLCRSHLDALLASIAETEKQTELAARVSTWKQRIEQKLEEQDSVLPFDIHEYGEGILDKLSLNAESGNAMSFTTVVRGQEKHDVARTFSALLQLVNNGDVDIERAGTAGELICHTAVNPFKVRLLRHNKRRKEVWLLSSKKRANSPLRKGCMKSRDKSASVSSSPSGSASPQLSSSFPLKLGKVGSGRCSPDGKRRRRSRFLEPVDLHSAR